jgi:response regulator RpfG family c-di-GMP phosphodiesterase
VPTIKPQRLKFMADSLDERQQTFPVVEDTGVSLEWVVRVRNWANFDVLQAASGSDALRVAAKYPGKIDLLLSDVRPPGMSGPHLAELLKQSRPEMQVMLMSAFIGGRTTGSICYKDFDPRIA